MEGWLRWVQGVEAAPPVPAGTMGQDPDGQRTWALGKQRLPAGESNAKALGMAERSRSLCGSLKVGLCDGALGSSVHCQCPPDRAGRGGQGACPRQGQGQGQQAPSPCLPPCSALARHGDQNGVAGEVDGRARGTNCGMHRIPGPAQGRAESLVVFKYMSMGML